MVWFIYNTLPALTPPSGPFGASAGCSAPQHHPACPAPAGRHGDKVCIVGIVLHRYIWLENGLRMVYVPFLNTGEPKRQDSLFCLFSRCSSFLFFFK